MKNKIDQQFENIANFIYGNAKWLLGLTLLLTLMLAFLAPSLPQDFKVEAVLRQNDESILKYNAFRDVFGRDEILILGIETDNVFTEAFIAKLKELHRVIENETPYLDEAISLINVRNVRGDQDSLIVEDLFEHYPETASLETIRERASHSPLYTHYLINETATFTAIIIKSNAYSSMAPDNDESGFSGDIGTLFDSNDAAQPKKFLTDKENDEIVLKVKEISERFNSEDFKTYLAGFPAYDHYLNKVTMTDTQKFMGMGFLVCAVFLWVLFRRISGVIIPLIVVMFTTLATFGIMVLIEGVFKLPTQILPNFIFAVGIGASVHLLSIFFQKLKETGDKKASIVFAMGHSGLPILLTSLTTIGGVLSLCSSSVAPIADLGLYLAIGITLSFIYTIVLIPQIIAVFPLNTTLEIRKTGKMGTVIQKIADTAINNPVRIALICSLLICFSLLGISRLEFGYHPMSWFPESYHLRAATNKIDRELKGTMIFEVLIESEKDDILYNPEFMNRLDQTQAYLSNVVYEEFFVGKTWAATDVVKEVNQALHANDPSAHVVPDSHELLSQEFFLFESSGSDDLDDLTSTFRDARLTIKVPDVDARYYVAFLNDLRQHLDRVYPEYKTIITGIPTILFKTLMYSGETMSRSYIIAILVISFLMVVLLGNIRIGLISMIPNIFPILLCFGVLGLLGIKMNLFIILTGSIALGIAVDDTIHFMHNYKKYMRISGNPQWAIQQTMETAGRAMLVTTCVLSLSFFSLCLSCMSNIRIFGMVLGFSTIAALLSDFFLSPSLLILTQKWFEDSLVSESEGYVSLENDSLDDMRAVTNVEN